MAFNRLTSADLAALEDICPGGVLVGDSVSEDYQHDEMPIYGSFAPEAMVLPTSTQAVSAVLAYCHSRSLPVTPRGSGTGLCGGAVPIHGGVLLSTERMNHILELDADNLCVTVEAGVLLMELADYALERGLLYPPEPGEKSATLGGNVMTNAGGMKAVKYGVTRDYVLGMEVVLADGRILNLGGKLSKNSSGYSLLHLMIGSEGTLGIVTKLILRLVPKPQKTVSLLVPFDSLEQCIETVPRLLAANLGPTAVEFMQREVILESEKYLGVSFPDKSSNAYLLLSFDGDSRQGVDAVCERAAEICIESGARDALYADTSERLSGLWGARGAFLEAIKSSTRDMDECDVVVPRTAIAEFVTFTHQLESEAGVRIRSFGHAGDGNIHIYLCRDDLSESAWQPKLEAAMRRLYQKAEALGGKVSGEHGIGHAKIEYLRQSEGELSMALMVGIKQTFDPKGILNPGKVTDVHRKFADFDEEVHRD